MEKYVEAGQAKDDFLVLRMRFVCFKTRATNTRSEFVTIIAFLR
jgi:hypothetical protein